jgi:hypothetical protein
MVVVDSPTRPQCLARWTDIDVPPAVELELGPRKRAIVPLAFVPHGDVGNDAGAGDRTLETCEIPARERHSDSGLEWTTVRG